MDGITDSMDMSLSGLRGDGDGQGDLACCSPWGRKESEKEGVGASGMEVKRMLSRKGKKKRNENVIQDMEEETSLGVQG